MIKNIIAAIIIGLSVSSFFILIKPMFASIQAGQFDANQLEDLVTARQDLAVAQQDLETRFRSISNADVDRLNTLLPAEVDNVRLILEIEKLVEDSGLQLAEIDTVASAIRSEEESEAIQVVSVDLEISGQYPDFIKFMKKLESGLRLIDVVSVGFNSVTANELVVNAPAGGSNNTVNLPSDYYDYSFTLQTYWLP